MTSKERLMLVLNRGKLDRLPVKIALIDESKLPVQISMLTTLDLIQLLCVEHEFDRSVLAMQGPLPTYRICDEQAGWPL